MIESIGDDELNGIQTQVAGAYGVNADDVILEVIYQTTGSMEVDIEAEANINELEESLEQEISILLGIHESNVEVKIEDGAVTYTITSDDVQSVRIIQNNLNEPGLVSNLEDALQISISDFVIDNEISADIVVTVDSSGATNNIHQAGELLNDIFEDNGFETSVKSTNYNH